MVATTKEVDIFPSMLGSNSPPHTHSVGQCSLFHVFRGQIQVPVSLYERLSSELMEQFLSILLIKRASIKVVFHRGTPSSKGTEVFFTFRYQ